MRFDFFLTFGRMAILAAAIGSPVNAAQAAGALAVGKCGAYGHAYDYGNTTAALNAARAQCKGECRTVTMNRACAAFSIDLRNPCGAHAYAVAPRISGALNASLKDCYKYGGKECVIRAWACDARG